MLALTIGESSYRLYFGKTAAGLPPGCLAALTAGPLTAALCRAVPAFAALPACPKCENETPGLTETQLAANYAKVKARRKANGKAANRIAKAMGSPEAVSDEAAVNGQAAC